MEMNGVPVSQRKTSFFVSTNIQGRFMFIHPFGFKNVRVEKQSHSYGGYGQPSWGYGVRNFVFHASDIRDNESQLAQVESWIRLEEGDTRAHVWLDNTLV